MCAGDGCQRKANCWHTACSFMPRKQGHGAGSRELGGPAETECAHKAECRVSVRERCPLSGEPASLMRASHLRVNAMETQGQAA